MGASGARPSATEPGSDAALGDFGPGGEVAVGEALHGFVGEREQQLALRRRAGIAPLGHASEHLGRHAVAGLVAIEALPKQSLVGGEPVPQVGHHGELDRVIEVPVQARERAHPLGRVAARITRDAPRLTPRGTRESRPNPRCELRDQISMESLPGFVSCAHCNHGARPHPPGRGLRATRDRCPRGGDQGEGQTYPAMPSLRQPPATALSRSALLVVKKWLVVPLL